MNVLSEIEMGRNDLPQTHGVNEKCPKKTPFNHCVDPISPATTMAYRTLDFDTSIEDLSDTEVSSSDSVNFPDLGACAHESGLAQGVLKHYISAEERFYLNTAVLSLYKDQLRPTLVYLQCRLQELQRPLYLQRNCLSLYELFPETYRIEPYLPTPYGEESREQPSGPTSSPAVPAAVYLQVEPSWFDHWVDLCSIDQDQFSIHTWASFYSFLIGMQTFQGSKDNLRSASPQTLDQKESSAVPMQPQFAYFEFNDTSAIAREKELSCPQLETHKCYERGLYEFASHLKLHGPDSLREYSLGRLRQFVHLAVLYGKKTKFFPCFNLVASGIVAHRGCHIVPRGSDLEHHLNLLVSPPTPGTTRQFGSKNKLPRSLAVQKPQTQAKDTSSLVITDLNEIHEALEIFMSVDQRFSKPMLLSQFKLKFYDSFRRHLDPLAFGYVRLSDFLSEQCRPWCRLIREGGRKVFVDRPLPPGAQSLPPPSPHTVPEQSQRLNGVEDLFRLLAKHYAFHSNLTYAFWQYRQSRPSVNKSAPDPADTRTDFVDHLFKSMLRPVLVIPPSPELSPLSSDSTDAFAGLLCRLKWFTRQPLIHRRLARGGKVFTAQDEHTIHAVACSILATGGAGSEQSNTNIVKSCVPSRQRPSRLKRLVTSQMVKLYQGDGW